MSLNKRIYAPVLLVVATIGATTAGTLVARQSDPPPSNQPAEEVAAPEAAVATSEFNQTITLAPAAPLPMKEQQGDTEIAVPQSVEPSEVEAVAESTRDELKGYVDGETTIAEITRDSSKSPDPGADNMFWNFSQIFGLIFAPVVMKLAKRFGKEDMLLIGSINTAGLVLFYIIGWAVLARSNPGLPQDWNSWLNAALQGTTGGNLLLMGMMGGRKDPNQLTTPRPITTGGTGG